MTLHDIILHNYKPYKNHRTQVLLLRLCVEGMFRGPWAMTHTLNFLSAFNLGFQIIPTENHNHTIKMFTFTNCYPAL